MIEVQSLTKKFNGRTVLNNISFQVKEGEVFGYLGPNGAGKTTTMSSACGTSSYCRLYWTTGIRSIPSWHA